MTESEKEELLYTAVTECRERADQQTSADNDDVVSVNSCSRLSASLSTRFKLVRIHAPVLDWPDSRVTRNYLRHVPGESDSDALVFWRPYSLV